MWVRHEIRSNIRGILIFLLAFVSGTAVVPQFPVPDVPPIDVESLPSKASLGGGDRSIVPAVSTPKSGFEHLRVEIWTTSPDREPKAAPRSILVSDSGPKETTIDLEFGESASGQRIVLHPNPHQARRYKIEQQFETSMAIGDEGPHVDLTGWKHYISSWSDIEEVAPDIFVSAQLSEADLSRFPRVSAKEIISELKRQKLDKRWLELARTCTSADSGACYVSVSRVSLRISAMQHEGWEPVHTLHFNLPMGC